MELLDKITNRVKKGRGSQLLRPVDGTPCVWFMFVPNDFNGALNIEESTRNSDTEEPSGWSQGGLFAFSTGDVIYDTQKGYQKWSEALKHVRYCLQVTEASPVLAAKNKEGFRTSGKVTFNVLKNNETQTGLIHQGTYSTTQDDFVRLLIDGSCSVIDLKCTQAEPLLV